MEKSVLKKRVLITGANGGIGRELVSGFLHEGWEVLATFRSEPNVLEDLRRSHSAELHLFRADLSKEADVDALFSELTRIGLEPHSVIANAGKYRAPAAPLQNLSLSDFEETIANNLTSTFLTARGFFRILARDSAAASYAEFPPSLVLIGSTAGIYGETAHSDYAAAKAALQYGWMKTLKNEIVKLHPRGRVNTVAPGWTLTSVARGVLEDRARIERTLQTIALRKFGNPTDVFQAVLFLADPARSGHISGQLIEMSGGMEGRVLHSVDELTGYPRTDRT